ncbi:flavin-containing monooxygenase [Agitococcus lubricus]|uniref:Cation diffusion facilitator CzcD-associated flavoprotein CzcO n=1 Tax=Agitococcus lubricus TaxID=1077255 RepID=A0A2T5IYG6_9GAMM|nr:NAD(P)/FAD-dependent oxidoreductase [Agitococcus lubricus]PTQ89038.1 cation diffusion facilitator CzcD-associated flavoprotein CzcO [Agitococcus lubricus]
MQHDILIIGSGFGGQCAAINLLKRGITDFKILERRGFMGGTWCQNSYPGAAVDVQSPLYSISFEPYKWTQMFVEQAELEEYTHFIINKYSLRERTLTHCNVEHVRWDTISQQWILTTSQGELRARVVINASGPLSTPVIPKFAGRDSFQGISFHTNNWNHDVSLKGKRVAIIGSGASAAQAIPAIAPECGHLHVFQRTPHWVMPRPDRKFSGWQRALLGIKPLHKALRTLIYWELETRVIGFKYSPWGLKQFAENVARKHIEKQIADPELRAAVTPDYTIGCKRIILSNTLYPALCRDNVTLHTKGSGIAEITPTGILTTDGQHIELDIIIYSTGYDATDGVISYPVIGKEGRSLKEFWAEYPRAYLGTTMPGFPNFFVVTGPNTGIGHTSAIFVIEAQMNYIMKSLDAMKQRHKAVMEVSSAAEADYTQMIHTEMEQTVWKSGGCHSWYQSKSGHVIAMFPGFSFTYRLMANRFKPQHHEFS